MGTLTEATTLVSKALGKSPRDASYLVEKVYSEINASEVQSERLAAQIIEGVQIRNQADVIEAWTISIGFSLPRISINLTAGFKAPREAIQVGHYQDEIFYSFVMPDIMGHNGDVYILPLKSGESAWLWDGRPHNNEWGSHSYGSIMLAHNERVKKELFRRRRADGQEPFSVSTYLTGADEKNDIKAGDVAILIDDSELTNMAHPGHGPHGWFDGLLGEKFQPKAGRTSNQELAAYFANLARQKGKHLYAGIGVGTAGATEYQSLWEVGVSRAGFNEAQAMELTNRVLGKTHLPIGLIYQMGVTAEAAVWRETVKGEPYFTGLDLVLVTDKVGGEQSLNINHGQVVGQAIANAWEYRDMIIETANNLSNFPPQPFLTNTHRFALSARLPHTEFD